MKSEAKNNGTGMVRLSIEENQDFRKSSAK